MMNNTEKTAVLEDILTHAADTLGDITPLVLERFFHNHPEAQELFKYHGSTNSGRMAEDMVASATYCLTAWFERPEEIEAMFCHTVPHHEILNINKSHFSGLLAATMQVIEDTLPDDSAAQKAVWKELNDRLLALVDTFSLDAINSHR